MKTQIQLFFFLLLAVPGLVFANDNGLKGKYTKEKKIKKEYPVSPDARVKIDNSYGNVNVVSWDQNTVVIEVTIKTNGNDEDKVQDKLDEINVNFTGNSSFVSAETTFNKNGSRSWWSSWRSSNVNMEINYEIKVPVSNDIDLSNDYGSIALNKIEGNAKISCDYGKLIIGELLGDNNLLNFDYTKNSNISYMKGGRIVADYSGFTLENGGDIELNADYSKSEFGDIANLNYNCDYGSLYTGTSQDVTGEGDYLSTKLGVVNGTININADYGSIRINELSSTARDVNIQSDYTGIKIGYDVQYHFNFNISLEYAGLNGVEDFEMIKKRIQSSDKYYEGYYGNSSSPNTININSEYGGVTFTRLN